MTGWVAACLAGLLTPVLLVGDMAMPLSVGLPRCTGRLLSGFSVFVRRPYCLF